MDEQEFLMHCRTAIETAISEATGKGVIDWYAVNEALREIESRLVSGAD